MTDFEEACFGRGPVKLRRSTWRRLSGVISARRTAHPGLFECGTLRLPGLETYALMRVREREALLLRQGYITQEEADDLWTNHLARMKSGR